jgi:hypothetical protein
LRVAGGLDYPASQHYRCGVARNSLARTVPQAPLADSATKTATRAQARQAPGSLRPTQVQGVARLSPAVCTPSAGLPRHNRHVRVQAGPLRADFSSAVRSSALYYAHLCGECWIPVPLPPPPTRRPPILLGRRSRRLGLSRRCSGEDLWTSPAASLLLPFSDRPVFSQALYFADLVQSLLSPGSRASPQSRVRISLAVG